MRVPYALSVYDDKEIDAVTTALKERKSILGDKTREFEARVAGLFGKKHGIMVNSGSSANMLAVELLNLQPGSEVITPALTFSTTVAPLVQKRLVPVFVDIVPNTYLIDIKQVENAITEKTKALMIPSLIGNVPNYPLLKKIASDHGIFLIEDSCDTLGAKVDGQPTGRFTDISTTSFYGSHIITAAGGGGMICVNNDEQMNRCKIMRGWGRNSAVDETEDLSKRFGIKVDGIPYDTKFVFSDIGYNFLPLEISAAFGNAQLDKLPKFIETRKNNFSELRRFFSQYTKFFSLPEQAENVETAWLAFPLTITGDTPFNRVDITTALEKSGIQTRPIFTGNILKQPGFKNINRGNFANDFPNANLVMERSFLVGCNQGLSGEHMRYMEGIFTEFLNKF